MNKNARAFVHTLAFLLRMLKYAKLRWYYEQGNRYDAKQTLEFIAITLLCEVSKYGIIFQWDSNIFYCK